MPRDHQSGSGRRALTPAVHTSGASAASAALQLSPLPAVMVDDAGLVLACNELFGDETGLPPALLVGREWWQAFAQRSAEDAAAAHHAIVQGAAPRGTTLLALLHVDGTVADLTVTWRRLSEPGTGRMVWVYAVTAWQRRAAGAEPAGLLATARVRATELAALAADEIDDALAAAAESSSPERAAAQLRATAAGLRRFVATREEPARLVRVGALVRGAIELAQPDRTVRVVDESRLEVRAGQPDPQRLVAHLLANALRHSPPGQPVEVRTYDEPGFACVAVRDHGPGIAPEVLAAASQPVFARGADATRGVGLAIARGIARALGGSLRLSADPGGGAVAVVALPVGTPARPSAAPDRATLVGKRVLIVDDEMPLARAVARVFRSAGGEVTIASSVAEADRELAAGAAFDAVVTDVDLPDGDGLALARRARAASPATRVFIVSGQLDAALAATAAEIGAAGTFGKPFDVARLAAEVSRALSAAGAAPST